MRGCAANIDEIVWLADLAEAQARSAQDNADRAIGKRLGRENHLRLLQQVAATRQRAIMASKLLAVAEECAEAFLVGEEGPVRIKKRSESIGQAKVYVVSRGEVPVAILAKYDYAWSVFDLVGGGDHPEDCLRKAKNSGRLMAERLAKD